MLHTCEILFSGCVRARILADPNKAMVPHKDLTSLAFDWKNQKNQRGSADRRRLVGWKCFFLSQTRRRTVYLCSTKKRKWSNYNKTIPATLNRNGGGVETHKKDCYKRKRNSRTRPLPKHTVGTTHYYRNYFYHRHFHCRFLTDWWWKFWCNNPTYALDDVIIDNDRMRWMMQKVRSLSIS